MPTDRQGHVQRAATHVVPSPLRNRIDREITVIDKFGYEEQYGPRGLEPRASPIHARYEIDIAAADSVIWSLLVRPYHWFDYYADGDVPYVQCGPLLELGTRFVMCTEGIDLFCMVCEFVPGRRLAWQAVYDDESAAYRAWTIRPNIAGCNVITEETRHGAFWLRMAVEHPGHLDRATRDWAEGLSVAACTLAQRRRSV
jgi:hypothetical protein